MKKYDGVIYNKNLMAKFRQLWGEFSWKEDYREASVAFMPRWAELGFESDQKDFSTFVQEVNEVYGFVSEWDDFSHTEWKQASNQITCALCYFRGKR